MQRLFRPFWPKGNRLGVGYDALDTQTIGILKPIPGIASKRAIVNFKLCQIFTLAGDATNDTVDRTVALSDPTDVTIGLGGNQPNGWEQWAAFYESAHVQSCSVSLSFNNVSTVHESLVLGVLASTDGTTMTSTTLTWNNWCEYPRTQHRHIRSVDLDAGAGATPARIRMNYHCIPARVYQKPAKNKDFKIVVPDTSATDIVYLHILLSNWDLTQTVATSIIQLTAVFRWTVVFNDRKNLNIGADS